MNSNTSGWLVLTRNFVAGSHPQNDSLTNMVDASGTNKYTYSAGGLLYTEGGLWASDVLTNIYLNRMRTNLSLQQPTGAWTLDE
jgi:hypothetical protein